jgi:hypothetical protein
LCGQEVGSTGDVGVGFEPTALTVEQIVGVMDLLTTTRTDRTRSGFVDCLELHHGNREGVCEPVDQLAVGPEVVRLLVDPHVPVRRDHTENYLEMLVRGYDASRYRVRHPPRGKRRGRSEVLIRERPQSGV